MLVYADRKYCLLVYGSLPLIFNNKRAFLIYKIQKRHEGDHAARGFRGKRDPLGEGYESGPRRPPCDGAAADERCLLFPIQPELVAF